MKTFKNIEDAFLEVENYVGETILFQAHNGDSVCYEQKITIAVGETITVKKRRLYVELKNTIAEMSQQADSYTVKMYVPPAVKSEPTQQRSTLTQRIFRYLCEHPLAEMQHILDDVDGANKALPVVQVQLAQGRKILRYLYDNNVFVVDLPTTIPCRVNWENPKAGTLLITTVVWNRSIHIDELEKIGTSLGVKRPFCQQIISDVNSIIGHLIDLQRINTAYLGD